MVKKAVIAAAGRGTRFLPVTKAYPKELLPVGNKPAIQLVVEELAGAGIEEILIVHQHGNSLIKRYFSPDGRLEAFLAGAKKGYLLDEWRELTKKVRLSFKPQPRSLVYGTGAPVTAAKGFVGKEPFVCVYADDLVWEKKPGRYLKRMLALMEKPTVDGVVGVEEIGWETVNQFGVVKLKEKEVRQVLAMEAIVERPKPEEAPSNLAFFGRMVLPARVIEILEKQKADSRLGEMLLTDAVTSLAKEGQVAVAPLKSEKWLTIGTPE